MAISSTSVTARTSRGHDESIAAHPHACMRRRLGARLARRVSGLGQRFGPRCDDHVECCIPDVVGDPELAVIAAREQGQSRIEDSGEHRFGGPVGLARVRDRGLERGRGRECRRGQLVLR